jgi:hypothetical protein
MMKIDFEKSVHCFDIVSAERFGMFRHAADIYRPTIIPSWKHFAEQIISTGKRPGCPTRGDGVLIAISGGRPG